MNQKIDMEQLRADLDVLSAEELEAKYPNLKTKSLKGLTVEQLEQRISKSWIQNPTRPATRFSF